MTGPDVSLSPKAWSRWIGIEPPEDPQGGVFSVAERGHPRRWDADRLAKERGFDTEQPLHG